MSWSATRSISAARPGSADHNAARLRTYGAPSANTNRLDGSALTLTVSCYRTRTAERLRRSMDLLFDPAWYMPVGLLVVAWGVVSSLVQTPKERALAHTRSLLKAYAAHDWTRLETLLDPTTTLA